MVLEADARWGWGWGLLFAPRVDRPPELDPTGVGLEVGLEGIVVYSIYTWVCWLTGVGVGVYSSRPVPLFVRSFVRSEKKAAYCVLKSV